MDHDAAADDCVIRVEGILDGVTAGKIEAMLVRAKAGARFVIDMSQVREFHDFGIAVLGHAMTRSAARVALRGLRHHQVRVLRYFGIDAAAVERALVPDAA